MKISIELVALTGSFITDSQRAAKEFEKHFGDIEKTAKNATKAIAAGMAAAVAATAAFTKVAIDSADKMGRSAQKIGVTTKSLSQLAYAAKLSDTEFDELSGGLDKLSKSAVDAASGNKEAASAFKALGVDVTDSSGAIKSVDRLMLDVADSFSRYEDGATKVAVAQKLFGKTGAELIPFLNEGRSGIEALMKEADRLGLTLDQNTADAANEFNDTLDRTVAAAQGVGLTLAKSLLPELQSLANRLNDPAIAEGLTKFVNTVVTLTGWAVKAAGAIDTLGIAIGEYYARLNGAFSDDPTKRFDQISARIKEINYLLANNAGAKGGQFDAMREELKDLTQQLDGLQVAAAADIGSGHFFEGLIGGAESLKAANDKALEGTALLTSGVQALTAAGDGAKRGVLDFNEATGESERAAKRAAAALKKMQEEATKAALEYAQAVADIISAIDAEDQSLQGLTSQRVSNKLLADQIALMKRGVSSEQALFMVKRARLGIEADLLDAAGKATEASIKRAEAEQAALDNQRAALQDIEEYLKGDAFTSVSSSIRDALGAIADPIEGLIAGIADIGKLSDTVGANMNKAWIAAGGAIDAAGKKIDALKVDQKQYGELVEGINSKALRAQIGIYGDLAGAAATFFEEGSSGYRTLTNVSKAFHAIELAMTIAEIGKKAVLAVLNQANGDPYTAFGRMAAMAAAVAALGVAVGGFGGGGGGGASGPNFDTVGTGSVLGDQSAQSESLANALEQLEALADKGLQVSTRMLMTLRSIDQGIDHLAVTVARSFQSGGASQVFKDVLTQSIHFTQQSIRQLLAGGQVGSTTGFGFGLTPGSSPIVNFGDSMWSALAGGNGGNPLILGSRPLDEELQDEVRDIVGNIVQSGLEAVRLLGGDVQAAQAQIDALDLGLDQIIDPQSLTGEQLEQAFQAIFSELGDSISTIVLPGIESFQRNGEGMLETLVRVASEAHAASAALDDLGISLGNQVVQVTQSLVDLAGGFDNLIDDVQSFYDAFFSEEEKIANSTDHLTEALADLTDNDLGTRSLADIKEALEALYSGAPDARDLFRDLVTGLDLTTDSGSAAFVTLTSLSDLADAVYTAMEEAAAKAEAAQRQLIASMQDFASSIEGMKAGINGLGDAFNQAAALAKLTAASTLDERISAGQQLAQAVQQQYQVQRQAVEQSRNQQIAAINSTLQAQISGYQEAAQAQSQFNQRSAQAVAQAQEQANSLVVEAFKKMQDAAAGLLQFADSLRVSQFAPGSPKAQLAESRKLFNELVAKARAGDADAATQVAGQGEDFIQKANAVYGVAQPFVDVFNEVQSVARDLGGSLKDAKAPQLVVLDQISERGERTNQILDAQIAQAQADAQEQIDAINRQSDEALAQLRQQTIDALTTIENAVLGGNVILTDLLTAITAGDAAQQALLASQIAAIQSLNGAIGTAVANGTALPAFAGGGITSGPSLAGEAGPEAVIPIPNGYVPVQLQGGGASPQEMLAELRAMRQRIDRLDPEITVPVTVVTERSEVIEKRTLKRLKDGTLNGDPMIHARGVVGRAA